LAFWLSRCFRSDARRIIFALALPAASVLDGCILVWETCGALPGVGINGRAGHIAAYWARWVFMGPVNFGLALVIISEQRVRTGFVLACRVGELV
jgi:hypothetical protein